MSSRSTYTTYDPRASSSSVSSRGSASYVDYRVPVYESSGRYGSNGGVNSVTRNNVQVTNHKQRMSDPAEPRSSDAGGYYRGSSYSKR